MKLPVVTLRGGLELPPIALGTWMTRSQEEADVAVRAAVDAGYRSIDAAMSYENETAIREAVKKCGVSRDEIFLTTKLWNNAHGYDEALRTFDRSEKNMGRVDIYLIHWPGPGDGFLQTWRAMERIYKEKRVKAIGVCNFMRPHLELLMANCEIMPMIDQIECHLYLVDEPLIGFCFEHGIQVEAWSPLTYGQGLLNDPVLAGVAEKYGRSSAQIALRYLVQRGIRPLPKSSRPERIRENIALFDFELAGEDMDTLAGLNVMRRVGHDPYTFFVQEYV